MDAVIKEMDYVAENFQDKVLDTVYIGGGTPTTLEPEQLDRLITALKSKFDFSTVKEFTVEAGRPDSITEDKFKVLRAPNISRISINPQTMKQETLEPEGYDVVDMNLLEKQEVVDVIENFAPDYIFHLAAQSSVAVSWSNPQLTVDVNIKGALNLLDVLKEMEYKGRVLLLSLIHI